MNYRRRRLQWVLLHLAIGSCVMASAAGVPSTQPSSQPAPTSQPDHDPRHLFAGTIMKIDRNSITIRGISNFSPPDVLEGTFKITPETTVVFIRIVQRNQYRDGRFSEVIQEAGPAKFEDLKPGIEVNVERQSETPVQAYRIDIRPLSNSGQ